MRRAVSGLAGYAVVLVAGLPLIKLAVLGILSSGFGFLGVLLLTTSGMPLIAAGLKGDVRRDKLLMKSNYRLFSLDRILFERYGEAYFRGRSVPIGVILIAYGVIGARQLRGR